MSKTRKSKPSAPDCCAELPELLSPKLFKALSDPKRISLLLRLLQQRGPCTVGGIAEGSGVDLSVVSRHLAILRDAGILGCVKQGKQVWCVVQTDAVVKVLRELADAIEACCPEGCRVDTLSGECCGVPPADAKPEKTLATRKARGQAVR